MNNKLNLVDIEVRKSHFDELLHWKLKDKIFWAKKKIKEFLKECEKDNLDEVTVSFSGGKDSTVLLDLVLKTHKEMNCRIYIVPVYATEITFPSTITFIRNTIQKYRQEYPLLKSEHIVMPKKTWNEILSQNGYPIFSKQISTIINRVKNSKTKNNLAQWFFGVNKETNSTSRFKLGRNRLFLLDDQMLSDWPKLDDKKMQNYFKKYNDSYFFSEKCCDYIKGNLKHDMRPSFIGTMAQESQLRKKSWMRDGCNIYSRYKKKSRPLSIWTDKDVWQYISEYDIDVNPAYNFDHKLPLEKQKLRFNRLGCTSCPYGSWMEQKRIDILAKKIQDKNDYKLKNRFEKLKDEYPNLYLSQVIYNGMYKVLIDMKIKIKNDDLYMKLFYLRWQQIDDWYSPKKFQTNILRIMTQIENYKDYKNKGDQYVWSYKIHEFNEAMNHFGFNKKITIKEINEIRSKTAKQYRKLNDKNNIIVKSSSKNK